MELRTLGVILFACVFTTSLRGQTTGEHKAAGKEVGGQGEADWADEIEELMNR